MGWCSAFVFRAVKKEHQAPDKQNEASTEYRLGDVPWYTPSTINPSYVFLPTETYSISWGHLAAKPPTCSKHIIRVSKINRNTFFFKKKYLKKREKNWSGAAPHWHQGQRMLVSQVCLTGLHCLHQQNLSFLLPLHQNQVGQARQQRQRVRMAGAQFHLVKKGVRSKFVAIWGMNMPASFGLMPLCLLWISRKS